MKYLLIFIIILIGNSAFAQITENTLQESFDEVIVLKDEVDPARIYDKKTRTYSCLDELPIPPGGWPALQYIVDNLDYDCSKIQEKSLCVVCVFIVETDGSLSRVKIWKTSGIRKFDRAVVNLVKKMPPWTPGKIKGQSVRAKSAFPVSVSMVQWYMDKNAPK